MGDCKDALGLTRARIWIQLAEMVRGKILGLLSLLLIFFGFFSCHRKPPPPNVILIIIDTVRKDHFSCYGYQRETTPRIDEFAKEAVKFENAIAPSPWTLPSIASILTGLWPHRHLAGYPVKDEETGQEGLTYLSESAVSIAEVLLQQGYQTVGFFQNPFVDPAFRLNRGFELYDYFPGDNLHIRRADQVIGLASRWLERYRRWKKPFFMVVHIFDPHLAYDPPSEFALPYVYEYKGDLRIPFAPDEEELNKIRQGKITYSSKDKNFIIGLYDGELSFVDHWVGEFFDYLKEKKIYDNSLIILTADHGEEFWEHNSFEHGHSLYQEVLLVPLLIRFPGGENAGLVVKEYVSLVDIAPSILAYLGIETSFPANGRSFISMPGAVIRPFPRPVISELNRIGPPLQCIIKEPYKLILNTQSGKIEIYNLEKDPGEKENLFGKKLSYPPEIIDQIRATANKIQELKSQNQLKKANLDQETLKKLKSLGYLK